MAEGGLFSFSSKLVSTIASPSFKKAYAYGFTGEEELEKTSKALKLIQEVMPDAEKKQGSDGAVKDWIGSVREVLYEADDLFDGIATDHLLGRMPTEKGENCLLAEISMSLVQLSDGVPPLGLVRIPYEEEAASTGMRKGVGTGWLADPRAVLGRDEDLKAIVERLLDDGGEAVIALVGMPGFGKSTLARLVSSNEQVRAHFDKIWRKYSTGTIGKNLIVLEEEDHDCGLEGETKGLLWRHRGGSGDKWIKMLVTATSLEDHGVYGVHTFHVGALSSTASWELFKRIAFTREQFNDPNWNNLGRKILKRCANNPLVIRSVASLLYAKTTKDEWASILQQMMNPTSSDPTLSALKMCYDCLPSNLKQCIAYCSLFPKYYRFTKDESIRLWIAQGFVSPNRKPTVEAAGEADFMELLRRSFFQEDAEEDEYGEDREIIYYKIHELIHDLAMNVAGEECRKLLPPFKAGTFVKSNKTLRHLSIVNHVRYKHESSLYNNCRLRSFLLIGGGSMKSRYLEQLTSHKFVRAVHLQNAGIKDVPSSIGVLKHLRYLDLSGNNFRYLPEFITRLPNLLTFNVSSCDMLKELPADFSKLINLRHLDVNNCRSLKHMPPGIEDLTCLQELSGFKVGSGRSIGDDRRSRLAALARLQLKTKLLIDFAYSIADWDEDEWWEIPTTLQKLEILSYPGMRMPLHWGQWRSANPSLLPKLTRLSFYRASRITHLPPLRCLPCLKALHLLELDQLEYIEAEQNGNESGQIAPSVASSSMLFFPYLEDLSLARLPRLKAWSTEEEIPSFPLLSTLRIVNCWMFKSMPLPTRLRKMSLQGVRGELIQQILPSCSHSLETISISYCGSMNSFSGEALTSLQDLRLYECYELRNLHLKLPKLNALEKLEIRRCRRLKLWGKDENVDWDSLTNLRQLSLDKIPDAGILPSSLQQRQSLGKLVIRGYSTKDNY